MSASFNAQTDASGRILTSSGFFPTSSTTATSRSFRIINQETIGKDVPELSSFQKATNFVETHQIQPTNIDSEFYKELRQHHAFRPTVRPVPITIHRDESEFYEKPIKLEQAGVVEETMKLVPSNNREAQQSVILSEGSTMDEKTVTIKKKTIRRKKAGEKVSTLRDSYIEKVAAAGNRSFDDSSSESEPEEPVMKAMNSNFQMALPPPIKQTLLQKSPGLNKAAEMPVIEDKIEAITVTKRNAEIPFENLSKFDKNAPPSLQIPSENEYRKAPDWTYKDSSIPRVRQQVQYEAAPMTDMTNHETVFQEKQFTPMSTYSAHKENIRSQIYTEKTMGSRILPTERRTNETTEEVETITLQPIGKGVQDLTTGVTLSRPPSRSASRAATPRGQEGNFGNTKASYYREEQRQTAGYNTMPSAHRMNKVNSARNISQLSSYDISDSYRRMGSGNRATGGGAAMSGGAMTGGNEQIVTSWHQRTESYTGGGRAYNSPISPISHQESLASNAIIMSGGMEETGYSLQAVLSTENEWYRPHISREDVIVALRDKQAGSFLIRNSTTFAGAYGLAVKVVSLPANVVRTNDLQSDLVRHFLIETIEDASGSGVRLKGFANEPVYPTLAHLVLAHTFNAIALPTRLILPTQYVSGRIVDHMQGETSITAAAQSQAQQYQYESHQQQQIAPIRTQMVSSYQRSLSTPGVNFIAGDHSNPLHQRHEVRLLYLGKIEVDRRTGDDAIEYAVDKVIQKKNLKTTTVELQLDSTSGLTITDRLQKLFYTRQFPAQHILWAGFDPKRRQFNAQIIRTNSVNGGEILGVVVKKQKMIMKENAVHLFCEFDSSNDLQNVTKFISENYLSRF